ncbi:MFS transporter [Pseudoxanthomonas winnipegensis]|uniref:spinster family MFS transporter n=1 Tax=Pseudoxanthomonas winnipegensis TaxID=2480810 RepID=UPI0030F46FD5
MGTATADGHDKGIRSGAWWALMLLIAVNVQSFVDRTILSSLGETLRRDLGIGDSQLGLLSGLAFALTYSVLGIPAAILSERIPRKLLITVALLLWSVMTMICGLAMGFVSLLIFRAGVGIGEAGFAPAAHALISDFFPPRRRALALSIFGAAIPVGVLIAAIGGGWLVHATHWRHAFLVVGAPGLILAPLIYFTMREPRRGESEGGTPGVPVRLKEVVRRLLRTRSALPIILAGAFAVIPGYAVYIFGVSYFVRVHQLELVSASTAFGIIVAGGQFAGMILGGALAERLARQRPSALLFVPAVTLFLGSIAMLIAWQQSGILACMVLLAAGMVLAAAFLGPSYAALHGLLTPRMRATGLAVVLLMHTLIGMGLGPPLIGFVSDRVATTQFGVGFAETCRAAERHVPATLSQACDTASAAGITSALSASALFALLAAGGFFMAGRRYPHDLTMEAAR